MKLERGGRSGEGHTQKLVVGQGHAHMHVLEGKGVSHKKDPFVPVKIQDRSEESGELILLQLKNYSRFDIHVSRPLKFLLIFPLAFRENIASSGLKK